jgi:hypothetical protein
VLEESKENLCRAYFANGIPHLFLCGFPPPFTARQTKTMVKIHHIHQTASLFLFPNAFTTKRPILSPRSLQFSFKSFQSSSTRLMALVSIPEAIAAHSRDDSIFVDGSWHMPNTRNARDEFRRGPRIVGARYFDIDTVW